MEEINEQLMALITSIRESETYRKYQQSKEELEADPELKKRVDAFRIGNFHMQNATEDIDLYAESDKITDQYNELRKYKAADNFLDYELKVCKMLQFIKQEVVKSVDLGLDDVLDQISL